MKTGTTGGSIVLLSHVDVHPDSWSDATRVSQDADKTALRSRSSGPQAGRIAFTLQQSYNPAKTVADCFKYRNKIGLDVALEALRDCRGQKQCSNDDLWHYAKICRVANVMRPYLEATA